MPRISLLLPVYNEAPYLSRCLDSLLEQDFGDFEIVITDNASTDQTWPLVQKYAGRDPRIKVHRFCKEVHVYENLLRSFQMSSSELVYHLGGDDYLQSASFLRRAVGPFEEDPRLGAFITRLQYFDSDSGQPIEMRPPDAFARLFTLESVAFAKAYMAYCSHDEPLVAVYRRHLLAEQMQCMVHWGLESAGWWICLAAYMRAARDGYRYRFDSDSTAVLMKRCNKPRPSGSTAASSAGHNVNARDRPAARVLNSVNYALYVSQMTDREHERRALKRALLFGMRRKTDGAPWFPGAGWSILMGRQLWGRVALQLKERTPLQILRRVFAATP